MPWGPKVVAAQGKRIDLGMSPERQAAVVAMVASGDAPDIRAAVASTPGTDEAEAAARKELTPNPATAEAPARPTTAQKWARHLADQMSVLELREVRDAIDEILAAADHGGSAAVH
jgi:hypothetical protein